ncbi:outer membrane autotransporter protein [Nitrobacteraceae bacterium AZCC 1564]
MAAVPAYAANINVANEMQLRNAISVAQNGDTISLTANITLTSNLPQVQRNVTISGNDFTLSGNNQYRGLFVQSGAVSIFNLKIANCVAQGGNGGSGWYGSSNVSGSGAGGGGAAGLGGALFIGSSANVTVFNVYLQNNQARGGDGGGLFQPSGLQGRTSGGGGGMFGNGGNGGSILDGNAGAGGGGTGGGGAGGFGGGGGGAAWTRAGDGGFGGGGGGAGSEFSTIGSRGTPGNGGFGGGNGSNDGRGGGGAGMGGAIFVQQGGTLSIKQTGFNISGNTVAGGSGGQNGQAYGSGIFLQGNGSLSFDSPDTQTISDAIADQTGVAKSGGSWSLVKNGAGTLILTGANAYSGGTIVNGGILQGNTVGLQGNITNNASVVFDQTDNGTYAGNISGTGSLIKSGSGDVTLSGTNTYSGGTTVNGGALLFLSDANLGASGAGITLNNGTIGTVNGSTVNQTVNRPVTITNNGGFQVGAINGNPGVLTWGGVISGAGTLVKSGSGDLILSGINTYSGGTTVTGGVVRFTTDANLGAAGAGITLNGGSVASTDATAANTTIGRNITLAGTGGIGVGLHPLIWSGNISGAGQFIKSGNGELWLQGTNTYSGGTLVQRGTLRIDSDDKLGAAGKGVTLDNNAALRASATFTTSRNVFLTGVGGVFIVDPTQALTLSGIVSGANITKIGAGTLILTGANTYAGNIQNNGGTVQGNTTSLRGNIVFDSNADNPIARSVTFDQAAAGTFAGNITGLGSLSKIGAGTLTLSGNNNYSGGTTVSAGTLQGTSNSLKGNILNNAALIFDQNFDGIYADVVSGAGTFTKNGTGKLTISGIQTYTGATNINAGNLNVNGSLKSSSVVNVNKGGTLSGNGTFGNVNVNGGTVSPGNSIGTLHIDGNYNMGPDSKYYAELNGTTSDRIEVTGTANIQSSMFEIAHDTNTASAPVLPGKTYTLLTTGGGLTVTAPTLATADFPFLAFTLSTDGFNGYLSTARSATGFADLASTPNEKAVAGALDTAATSNPVWQQVVGASDAQARAAFTSLSNAAIHANAAGVLSEQSQYLRDAVTGRLRQDFAYGTPLAQGGNALSYAEETPRNAYAALPFTKAPPALQPAQVYAVWAQALGSLGTLKGDGNAAKTDHTLGGVISGIDVTFNGLWRVGLAGGYSHSSFKSPDIAASGSSDSYHIAAYGGGQFGAWGLRGGASFSWNDLLTSRQVVVVNLVDTQRGDYGLKTTQMFGEVGHTYAFNGAALEPFLNIAYVRVDGGINELGLAAVTGSTVLDTTYSTLGLRGATALTQTLTARGTLGWRHAFGDVTPLATLAFQSGSPFTLAGSPIARDALIAEAGLDYAVAPNAFLGVSWSGQFADQSHTNAIKGNFSWRF